MQAPAPGTLQRWALDYISSNSLAYKLCPPPAPRELCAWPSTDIRTPGRPAELTQSAHGAKSPGPEALRQPKRRAQLVHTFLHHELQAAELMCWALLKFSDMPAAFHRGLAKIAEDEIRHMQMYAEYMRSHGFEYGDFPVRDWFWDRVPAVQSAASFVATFGMGFEGGNLDHTARFAERFRAIGDEAGARLQEKVGEEEVPHVKFAIHWFTRLGHPMRFNDWISALPAPLSPMVMRGQPLDRKSRAQAGFDDEFLNELHAWQPSGSGF